MRFLHTISIAFLFYLSSCIEKETPVPAPHIQGDVTRAEVFIESDYSKQIFYNIESGYESSINDKTDWDFALSPNSKRILLNSSTFAQIVETSSNDWDEITNSNGYIFGIDHQNQSDDLAHISSWKESTIYIIDRGYDTKGKALGVAKIMLETLSNGDIKLTYGGFNENANSLTISFDTESNYTYISLVNGLIDIAPSDRNWHLLFGQYTHIIDDVTPYLVTGILINPESVEVTQFNDSSFATIDLSVAKQLNYGKDAAVIGYDWKTYNFEAGSFTVQSENNYVLKVQDAYYKLHLLDFYNSEGEKGNFHLEYQKL